MDRGPLNASIVEAFDILPPQLQTAARYMLDRPDDVALLSMREQARRAGVPRRHHDAARQAAGSRRLRQVRELYAGAVRAGTLGFAGKAGVQVEAQKLRGERALAAEMAQRLSRQIAALAEPASLERLADAAGRLHEARRVYCLGLRSCHAAAWHFHYMLSLLERQDGDAGRCGRHRPGRHSRRRPCRRPFGRQRRALCPRHHRRRALCGDQGVPVVALTDFEVSPLAQIAVAAILVATESPSFFHTMTPLLAVAEILAALVAGRGGNKALAALEHTEAQLSAFGVHLPRRGQREKA